MANEPLASLAAASVSLPGRRLKGTYGVGYADRFATLDPPTRSQDQAAITGKGPIEHATTRRRMPEITHLPSRTDAGKTNRHNVGDAYRGCLVVTVPRGRKLYWEIEGIMQGLARSLRPAGGSVR